jgi:hypothetical protein
MIEQGSHGEYLGPLISLPIAIMLRRGKTQRAEGDGIGTLLLFTGARSAKINQPDVIISFQNYMSWFEVSINYLFPVQKMESAGYLVDNLHNVREIAAEVSGHHPLTESHTFNVFLYKKRRVTFFEIVKHSRKMRIGHVRQQGIFPFQERMRWALIGGGEVCCFDDELPLCAEGEIHRAQRALMKELRNLVPGIQNGTWCERHNFSIGQPAAWWSKKAPPPLLAVEGEIGFRKVSSPDFQTSTLFSRRGFPLF